MTGTTSVDYAGTLTEARHFAAMHRGQFPHTFNTWQGKLLSPNGDPMLWAAWKNIQEREQVKQLLVDLGWEFGSQYDHVNKP